MCGSVREDIEVERSAIGALVCAGLATLVLSAGVPAAGQQPAQGAAPAVPGARLAGTVGTQAWAVGNPPPGASGEEEISVLTN